MQRTMSYDLDGAFALRDAGEIQTLSSPRTRVLRSPGLTNISEPNDRALREVDPTDELREAAFNVDADEALSADGTPVGTVTVPVLGQVNLIHVGVGIAIGIGLYALLKK